MSDEGERTCPLCAEEMDLTDQQLKPCRCGYEICVWCWHQIMEMAAKEDTDGRCPACRNPYDKEKIVGMAANSERMAQIHMERKRSQKAKTKSSDGRKQLTSVRVIQRNLVYIVGLPLNLGDEDLLQRREYFGQYGKVLKVSMSRTTNGVIQQFPNNTCSVYITYSKDEEAKRCIQSVHGYVLDGRTLKACFGTTKYCHAWLRNVPCTNPDCLYLHEIGSQEDSFTKDEIVSAFSRSRVQQITGTNPANSVLRRSGSMLPPPIDDYVCNSSTSAPKPIVKETSNNTMSTSKGSPPNGSLGRSLALPAAASWGTRVASQSQTANSTSSNGPTKSRPNTPNGTLAYSSAVTSSNQVSTLHSDVGKSITWNNDGQEVKGKLKLDPVKPVKQNTGTDLRTDILEIPDTNDHTASAPLGNHSPSSSSSDDDDQGSFVSNDDNLRIPSADTTLLKLDNDDRGEIAGMSRITSSVIESSDLKLSESEGLRQLYNDQQSEPLPEAAENKVSGPSDLPNWNTDSHFQVATDAFSEVEDDIISFDNQRLKDPEVVSRATYLPNSANSLHVPNHSTSSSLQHNEPFGAVSMLADPLFVDNNVGDRNICASSNTGIANEHREKWMSCSAGLDRELERSYIQNGGEKVQIGRLQSDANALDAGENSIISNILSLDLDSWDDSPTSQHLAKLLGDTDKQPSSIKMGSSWKVQNNNQSRFSFARQEESRHHGVDADTSPFSAFGQLQNNLPFGQNFSENRPYLDKFDMVNSFSSSNFGESDTFANGPTAFSSGKPSAVSRSQISAPPGFSVPNRAPPRPPGFSSHERMDQIFDTISGNHLLDPSSLLRNPYQAPPSGNISPSGDIEFMDPAILAVGKGRLQGGLNNQGLDVRQNFPQQLNAFENEARLKMLMQRSLSPHQNLRYTDIGDGLSSLSDSYGISSRLLDQSQMSNLSSFMQMPLQHSRNGLMSNGHIPNGHLSNGHIPNGHLSNGHIPNGHLSNGHIPNGHLSNGHIPNGHLWNEVQGVNNLGVAEILRNDRLGLNKFYSTGYEDSKFRMPSSGDLYNRAFEM